MKQRIKRIIAREGLTIISLILLALISLYLASWMNNQKELYEANAQEIDLTITLKDDPKAGHYFERPGITLRFPKQTSDDVIKKSIKRDFSNVKSDGWIVWDPPYKGENIKASYNRNGKPVFNNVLYKIDFEKVFIFFAIFAYPLYLLIRFIIWSIKTLMEQPEG